MRYIKKNYIHVVCIALGIIFIFPALISAQQTTVPLTPSYSGSSAPKAPASYTPLAPLPGVSGAPDPGTYFNRMIQLAIGIAGILSVLMIVVGGAEYLGSEAFTSKEAGVKKMQAAVWGLLLAIASWIILNTINPELVRLNFGMINPLNIKKEVSAPPPSNIVERQIEKATEAEGDTTYLRTEQGQASGKMKVFSKDSPEFESGERFELTQTTGLTKDLSDKAIGAATARCSQYGANFELVRSFDTLTCTDTQIGTSEESGAGFLENF